MQMVIRNKLLILASLVLSFNLNGQYIVKKDGQSVLTYGAFYKHVRDYTVRPTDIGDGDWTILKQWDFEDPDLGVFGSTEVNAYFTDTYTTNSMGGGDSIVTDTIDGVATQVLKICHESGKGQNSGFTVESYFDASETSYDSICLSFRHKFGKDFELMSGNTKFGAKLRGEDGTNYAINTTLFQAGYLLKPGMRFEDYIYSYYNEWTSWPWSWVSYAYLAPDDIYLHGDSTFYIPGVWYDETVCASMNTPGESDARVEYWTNDDMIMSMPSSTTTKDEFGFLQYSDQLGINIVRISSFSSSPDNSNTKDSYSYIDDVTVWFPDDDTYWDDGDLHPSGTSLTSPVAITDHTVYYDTLVNLASQDPDTIYSTGYPSDVSAGWTGAWLIDAGAGETVTATVIAGSIGASDWMQVYDSNDSNGDMLYRITTTDSDLTDSFDGGGASILSTGRYLYICAGSCESTSGTTAFRIKAVTTP